MEQKTTNNLFDLYRAHRAADLETILLTLTTKTVTKIVTYNTLAKNYSVIFSGYAHEVYKAAHDYLDVRVASVSIKNSEIVILV